jgi:amidohydrolase
MHPEIGLQEWRTAGIVAAELEELGYEVTTGVAQTGVVGVLEMLQPGPVVLLRFDMDALPLYEENDVPYRSQHDNLMHACGHDGHVAIGLGVATILARHREELHGTVKLMFQPGEEGLQGARLMIEEGVIDKIGPRPDVALGAHVWNDEALGRVGITAGPIMAAAEQWECVVNGKGGHGAAPHQTADPIVAAAQIILAWQTAVSRNVDPQETAVLSVCAIQSGDAFNIIPNTASLRGTIRTFDPEVRSTLLRRFEEIASGIGAAMECTVELNVAPLTPALVNDPEVTAVSRRVCTAIVGEEQIFESRTMGSEDMAYVNAEIPGCFLMVGSRNEDAGLLHAHHNSRFDFDEDVLPLTVELLVAIAAEYLRG